jgi:putative transposase
MSTLVQRSAVLDLIDQACRAGARLHVACALIGLAARTVQRWSCGWQKCGPRGRPAHP